MCKDALPKIDILASKMNGYRAPVKDSSADINVFITEDKIDTELLMKISWTFIEKNGDYLNFARGSFVDNCNRVIRVYLYDSYDKRNLAARILYCMKAMLPEKSYNVSKENFDFFDGLVEFDSLVLDTIAGSHCKSIETMTSKDDDLPF